MTNPYFGLPDHCFWSRAMTWPAPGRIDPVVSAAALIDPQHKVATMGSCFAQHLARHIQKQGLNYFVPETPPEGMTRDEAVRLNYGVFSARYGNVYTVRQALQMFYRAFGIFQPQDDVWVKKGGFVDAFRPQIDPVEAATVEEVRDARRNHLHHVRDVFVQSDWIVLTLGLTEAWQSRKDGAVYPVAPGVSGGIYDPQYYDFINFDCGQVVQDLTEFIRRIGEVNPRCRILLTVSPVPLIATYEPRHVWVSTTYSKAVLRVAAEEATKTFQNVHYFPSYEVITSPASGGRYYADDLRQVTDIGVKHVMRLFTTHYIEANAPGGVDESSSPTVSHDEAILEPTSAAQAQRPTPLKDTASEATRPAMPEMIVCDEEVIEQTMREHGFSR